MRLMTSIPPVERSGHASSRCLSQNHEVCNLDYHGTPNVVDLVPEFVNSNKWTRPSAPPSADTASAQCDHTALDHLAKFPLFHFVNLHSRRQSNPALLRAARAHVMRQVWKGKDDARTSELATRRVQDRAGTASSFIGDYETPSTHLSMASDGQLPSVAWKGFDTHSDCPELYSGCMLQLDNALTFATPAVGPLRTVDMKHIHHCMSALLNHPGVGAATGVAHG